MEFQVNIQAGKPHVRGVNSEYSGLLDVEVPLEPTPDRYWAQIFSEGPPGVSYSLSMHPPQLSGSTVLLRPPDNELDTYVDYLKKRVEGTNAHYNREIAPRLKRESEAQEAESADRARRVEEAQRRFDTD